MTEARREEMPVEPFGNKIEEGLAKRVPVAAIQRVLTQKLDDYRFTQSLLRDISKRQGKKQAVPPDYLLRFSESLSCGLSRESLRILLEHAFPSSPLSTLAIAVDIFPLLSEQSQFSPVARVNRLPSRGSKRIISLPKEKLPPDHPDCQTERGMDRPQDRHRFCHRYHPA